MIPLMVHVWVFLSDTGDVHGDAAGVAIFFHRLGVHLVQNGSEPCRAVCCWRKVQWNSALLKRKLPCVFGQERQMSRLGHPRSYTKLEAVQLNFSNIFHTWNLHEFRVPATDESQAQQDQCEGKRTGLQGCNFRFRGFACNVSMTAMLLLHADAQESEVYFFVGSSLDEIENDMIRF